MVRIARQKLHATTAMESVDLTVTGKLSVIKFELLCTHRRVPLVGLGHYKQVLDSSLVERGVEGHYCWWSEVHPAVEVPRAMAAEGGNRSVAEATVPVPETRVK